MLPCHHFLCLQQKLTDLESEWDDKINVIPHLHGVPISNIDINLIYPLTCVCECVGITLTRDHDI